MESNQPSHFLEVLVLCVLIFDYIVLNFILEIVSRHILNILLAILYHHCLTGRRPTALTIFNHQNEAAAALRKHWAILAPFHFYVAFHVASRSAIGYNGLTMWPPEGVSGAIRQ